MENFYKCVLDSLPVCTIIYDNCGKVIYRNRATRMIDGYEDGQMLGLSRERYLKKLQIKPGRSSKMVFPSLSLQPFNKGVFGFTETTLTTREGKLKDVLLTGDFIYDNEKQILGVCGCCLDISEHKKVEEIYRQTLEQIISNLPLGLTVYGLNGRLIFTNNYIKELAGVKTQFLGLTRREVLKELGVSPLEPHLDLFDRTLTKGEILSSTYYSKAAGKEYYYKLLPLRDRYGRVEKVLVATSSATYEDEYREIQYYLNAIVDNLDVGLANLDRSGRITLVNKFVADKYGVRKEEILGKNYQDLVKTLGPAYELDLKTLARTGSYKKEAEYHHGKKEISDLLSFSPVFSQDREFLGAIITSTDLTEVKARQKKIFEQEKLAAIGTMAAGMAHEIKNPLTTIRGFAQLLLEKTAPGETSSSYLETILEEVDRACGVINDFLLLARPRPPLLERQSISGLVEEIMAVIEPQAFLKKIAAGSECVPDLPDCLLDCNQIKQVVLNMCKNAFEAMPEGGILKISAGRAESEVYLEVSDTGCGIPGDMLQKIGTPFFTTKDSGTGLGLSICYSIVESHGGRIEVDSREGRGSRFRIYLPAAMEQDRQKACHLEALADREGRPAGIPAAAPGYQSTVTV